MGAWSQLRSLLLQPGDELGDRRVSALGIGAEIVAEDLVDRLLRMAGDRLARREERLVPTQPLDPYDEQHAQREEADRVE